MKKGYYTIYNETETEIEEKKSKFITNCKPVENEEDAIKYIQKIKSKYWDASHNVYCYNIITDSMIIRYSDDGEPSGTAGIPILDGIKRLEVSNIIVVVTRYFGGTLLGASGLIRTYRKAAITGITNSKIVHKNIFREIYLLVEYNLYGKLNNMLEMMKVIKKSVIFQQDVEIIILVEENFCCEIEEKIIEETNGRIIIEQRDLVYAIVSESGEILDWFQYLHMNEIKMYLFSL